MAMIHTFEADTAPLTIDDLFNVNDYYGVKLFGDAWNDVKKAACLIAQKAANAPIMFYLRSFANESTPGMHNPMSNKLWGYNDNAGVALLGNATWDALKGEFDELLGWSLIGSMKSVVSAPSRAVSWVGKKLQETNIPVVKEVGQVLKSTNDFYRSTAFLPSDMGERTEMAIRGQGYNTQGEINTQKEKEAAKQREQMLKDQIDRAGAAASAAARAQAEYEAKIAAMEEAAAAAGLTPASEAANAASANAMKTVLIAGGVGLAVYLITRKKGKK